MNTSSSSYKKGFSLFYVIFIILGIVIVGELIYLFATSNKSKTTTEKTSPSKVVAKAGDESLYQKDYEYVLRTNYANTAAVKREDVLKAMATDSVVLQAAAKDGIVKLDSSFYNSPNKDMLKRSETLEKIYTEVRKHRGKVVVDAVTIHFVDNATDKPLIPIEDAKKFAYPKIKQLRDDVVNKKITMEGAADKIRNDSSLNRIDRGYKTNAFLTLEFVGTPPYDTLRYDPYVGEEVVDMKVGDISDVYTIHDNPGDEDQYMFIRIKEKVNGKYPPITEWIETQMKDYSVSYY